MPAKVGCNEGSIDDIISRGARFDAAWRAWTDREAAPPDELATLVAMSSDDADRALAAAPFGAKRGEALAWQLALAVARAELCHQPVREFHSCATLARLARAASGAARTQLLALAIAAGGAMGHLGLLLWRPRALGFPDRVGSSQICMAASSKASSHWRLC